MAKKKIVDVQLGRRYRDQVTGFEGSASSAHEYANGCRRITLQTLSSDGDKIISLTFDEPDLQEISGSNTAPKRGFKSVKTGGPHDHNSAVDEH